MRTLGDHIEDKTRDKLTNLATFTECQFSGLTHQRWPTTVNYGVMLVKLNIYITRDHFLTVVFIYWNLLTYHENKNLLYKGCVTTVNKRGYICQEKSE